MNSISNLQLEEKMESSPVIQRIVQEALTLEKIDKIKCLNIISNLNNGVKHKKNQSDKEFCQNAINSTALCFSKLDFKKILFLRDLVKKSEPYLKPDIQMISNIGCNLKTPKNKLELEEFRNSLMELFLWIKTDLTTKESYNKAGINSLLSFSSLLLKVDPEFEQILLNKLDETPALKASFLVHHYFYNQRHLNGLNFIENEKVNFNTLNLSGDPTYFSFIIRYIQATNPNFKKKNSCDNIIYFLKRHNINYSLLNNKKENLVEFLENMNLALYSTFQTDQYKIKDFSSLINFCKQKVFESQSKELNSRKQNEFNL